MRQSPRSKKTPISREREARIKSFLEEAEESLLEIAERNRLEVYIETDTRAKFPSVKARIVIRRFLRDGQWHHESLTEQGRTITKRMEEE